MFQVAVKTKRQEQREGRDQREMPPTQIARALRELNIVWIAAHSPQAKGRVERQFGTAQDRLVKGMRVAGVGTLEAANAYLEKEYLPWWEQTLTVEPSNATDAHRQLEKGQNLAAILSHIEPRQVTNDHTIRYDGKVSQVDRQDVRVGMRKATAQVEERMDGSIAVRFQGRYVRVRRCAVPVPVLRSQEVAAAKKPRQTTTKPKRKSDWMKNFTIKPAALRTKLRTPLIPATDHTHRAKGKRNTGQKAPGGLSRLITQDLRSSEASPKKGGPFQKTKPFVAGSLRATEGRRSRNNRLTKLSPGRALKKRHVKAK